MSSPGLTGLMRISRASLRAHATLANYWRILKILYFQDSKKEMEMSMQKDCINVSDSISSRSTLPNNGEQYMNVVSWRMGLRRLYLNQQQYQMISCSSSSPIWSTVTQYLQMRSSGPTSCPASICQAYLSVGQYRCLIPDT